MLTAFIVDAIVQMLMGLAENAGNDYTRKLFQQIFTQRVLTGKIDQAAKRAYQRFEHESHDHELMQALDKANLLDESSIVTLLAQVATEQIPSQQAGRELTQAIQHAALSIPFHRCKQAAHLLVTLVHAEVGLLPELHQTIMILRGDQILEELHQLRPTPEYAPGIRESIINAAVAIANELKHGYVTTAHIFYALLVQPQGIVRPYLMQLDITPAKVRELLVASIAPFTGSIADPMTAAAVHILDRARSIARDSFAPSTRDDHVLLALLEQSGSSASMTYFMTQLHLDPATVHEIIHNQGQVVSIMHLLQPASARG
jgi:hypothetical protein